MSQPRLRTIINAEFRSNPDFKLVSWERLPQSYQDMTQEIASDPDFYGLLLPQGQNAASAKSACQNTALLFLSLEEPNLLPYFVKAQFGKRCNQAISELVLDGILQIGWNGIFVSGPDAYAAIYDQQLPVQARPLGKIAQLSLDALKHAQSMELNDSLQLSKQLYFYNRLPASPYWLRTFPSEASILDYLGCSTPELLGRLLSDNWIYTPPPADNDGWHSWARNRIHSRTRNAIPEWTYKLYLSPLIQHLSEAVQVAIELLTESDAFSFKIGKNIHGLLRPDKFVAYFDNFDSLQSTAVKLLERLSHIPAQGVPFTAELAENGLLSWGSDPPSQNNISVWAGRESWRLWVTNQLAIALLAAMQSSVEGMEPYQFALDRLHLEGVDTITWAPSQSIWHKQVQSGE